MRSREQRPVTIRKANFRNIGTGYEVSWQEIGTLRTMYSSAKEYRSRAAGCLEIAKRVSDATDKARLVKMAQEYFELADKLDRIASRSLHDTRSLARRMKK